MDGDTRFDTPGLLERIERATRELLRTAREFGDADVRAPSLLPGWLTVRGGTLPEPPALF